MESLRIEGTDETPGVHLDRSDGIFEISGRSLPEDAVTFYKPVFDWINVYAQSPLPNTRFSFKLDYFNTASSKIILDLLLALKNIAGIRIIWYAYPDDEEVQDAGKEFSEQVDIPFEFKVMEI